MKGYIATFNSINNSRRELWQYCPYILILIFITSSAAVQKLACVGTIGGCHTNDGVWSRQCPFIELGIDTRGKEVNFEDMSEHRTITVFGTSTGLRNNQTNAIMSQLFATVTQQLMIHINISFCVSIAFRPRGVQGEQDDNHSCALYHDLVYISDGHDFERFPCMFIRSGHRSLT